jgi:hypothetical protein
MFAQGASRRHLRALLPVVLAVLWRTASDRRLAHQARPRAAPLQPRHRRTKRRCCWRSNNREPSSRATSVDSARDFSFVR